MNIIPCFSFNTDFLHSFHWSLLSNSIYKHFVHCLSIIHCSQSHFKLHFEGDNLRKFLWLMYTLVMWHIFTIVWPFHMSKPCISQTETILKYLLYPHGLCGYGMECLTRYIWLRPYPMSKTQGVITFCWKYRVWVLIYYPGLAKPNKTHGIYKCCKM